MTSEMSRMNFESTRPSVDRSMNLDRKVIGHWTKTVSEPIYEDELVKNTIIEICYKVTNTNPNSIYIAINICSKGYNKYELCTYIDNGCSVCFGKRLLYPEFMLKRAKNLLQG